MAKNDPEWPKVAKILPKMAPNDPKWPKITPNGPNMTPGFTHFFRNFFLTEKAVPQTFSLLECMDNGVLNSHCVHSHAMMMMLIPQPIPNKMCEGVFQFSQEDIYVQRLTKP